MAVSHVVDLSGVPGDTIDISPYAAVGDLMLARLLDDNNTTEWTPPDGWTDMSSATLGATGPGAFHIRYHSYWKRVDATDIAAGITFPHTGTFGVAMIQIYRGALSSDFPIVNEPAPGPYLWDYTVGASSGWAYAPSVPPGGALSEVIGPVTAGVAGGATSAYVGFGYTNIADPSLNPPLSSSSRYGGGAQGLWGMVGTELLAADGPTTTYTFSLGSSTGPRGSNSVTDVIEDVQIILPEPPPPPPAPVEFPVLARTRAMARLVPSIRKEF